MSTTNIRVLIVDDAPDLAQILERLLNNQPDLEWVGTEHNAERLIEVVRSSRADVALIDLSMPGPPTLPAIRELKAQAPSCRVIVFSGYDDEATVQAALEAGASELVSKFADVNGIFDAIRRVMASPSPAQP